MYFCELGFMYKEIFEVGMCGVVFGGVMMIFEMFNMYLLMLDE